MRPSALPVTGGPPRSASAALRSLGGALCAGALGGLAGLVHARGAPWAHVGMAVAVGVGVGMALALRADRLADFWTVLSVALVVAVCARFQAGWALTRQESLWQRCSFVLAVLAVGAKLCLARDTPLAAATEEGSACEDARVEAIDPDAAPVVIGSGEAMPHAGPSATGEENGDGRETPPGRRHVIVLW